jgi:hypothetical protein
LHQYKDKFFSENNNQFLFDNFIENIHYRLWLYSSFYGKPKTISEFIKEQIINNLNLDENKLIDWRKFKKINGYNFEIIPLSFFDKNKIIDIFPNKVTKNFDYKDLSGKAVCKAELQKRMGLPVNPDVPLIGIVTRLAEQKGIAEVFAPTYGSIFSMCVNIV